MGYKAVLLDFYGTLVEEDDPILDQVTVQVSAQSPLAATPAQVSKRWWELMGSMCRAAHGSAFQPQREIEVTSLRQLLREFDAPLDPVTLTAPIFAHWQQPGAYPDATEFLRRMQASTCIVSNVDDADLHSAIDLHGWAFPHVVTSEQCRAYKPRPEMFAAALQRLGMRPGDVLHVGDSPSSDVAGAQEMGIDVAWVNRRGRAAPPTPPTYTVTNLCSLLDMITPRS